MHRKTSYDQEYEDFQRIVRGIESNAEKLRLLEKSGDPRADDDIATYQQAIQTQLRAIAKFLKP